MKTTSKIVLAVVALVLLSGGAVSAFVAWSFYRQNLRGIAPAIEPPPQDIAQLVDTREAPLDLPHGFSLGIFAKGLVGPRVIVADPNGVVFVSVPSKGEVVALPDVNGDGKADTPTVVLKGLNGPHGMAFRCVDGACHLYVAETNALSAYDYDPARMAASNRKVLANLPSSGEHVTRSLVFLPPPNDSTLLVAIGSTCNACNERDARRAAISQINVDGGTLQPYATGLRNSVFQTVDPFTQQVWITEMGRDFLGDDTPPDEINILGQGSNYGWPYCYGKNIHDVAFDKSKTDPCPSMTPSQIDLQAHSAPLGLAFIQGDGWPSDYQGNLLVAYHGSWNRSVPTGYKIVRIKIGPDGSSNGIEDFMSGWLTPANKALGRPVGLLVKPNGELFVSDDKAGVVYRVYVTK